MHSYDLILTLAGGLGAGLVPGYVTQRLGVDDSTEAREAKCLVGP
jgi:hypothetical protein